MKKVPLSVLITVFVLLNAGPVAEASKQAVAEIVRGTDKIPNNYKTYSLFLVCNPEWLAPEKSAGLYQLYQQFQDFGRTIGDDHVAVWFWKTRSGIGDAALAKNVDVERSVRFCQAWKLTPSKGPHLVVTSTYPDEDALSSATGLPKNSAVFELGNMNPKEISDLLANLTDQLIAKGSVPDSTTNAKPTLWVRLLEATQRTINNFGCAWSFKIDAGPVSADLHSCPPPKPS